MNTIFGKDMDEFMIIYINNIVVYSKTTEEHTWQIEEVLWKLGDNNLYVNGENSNFARQYIEFLCHEVTRDGITLDMKMLRIKPCFQLKW